MKRSKYNKMGVHSNVLEPILEDRDHLEMDQGYHDRDVAAADGHGRLGDTETTNHADPFMIK